MGGNVGGSASPSSTTTGSAAPSGGKGSNGPIQPYQGGQQAQQGGFGPFGLGGFGPGVDNFGGQQTQQTQQGGPFVGNMLQATNQTMQQGADGNPIPVQRMDGIAGLAKYPNNQLNQLQGLMGGFNGQFSPEADTFQNANPQGGQDTNAAQNAANTQQGGFMQHLLSSGYGKGGGGAMPGPYQGGPQSSMLGLYSSDPNSMRQTEPLFNPASDEGMVGPGSQMATQAVTPAPVTPAPVASTPVVSAPVTPAPAPIATQSAAQTPDQSQGLSFRGMTMKKGGRVK